LVAAQLTLGYFLTTLMVVINPARLEFACWGPIQFSLFAGLFSEFEYVGSLQQAASAALTGPPIGATLALFIQLAASHLLWLRIILNIVFVAILAAPRLYPPASGSVTLSLIAFGVVQNYLQMSVGTGPGHLAFLYSHYILGTCYASFVGFLIALLVFPVPVRSLFHDTIENVLRDSAERLSRIASLLLSGVYQATKTEKEKLHHQHKRLIPGADHRFSVSPRASLEAIMERGRPSITRSDTLSPSETSFSVEATIFGFAEETALLQGGSLYLHGSLVALQRLLPFGANELTYPTIFYNAPVQEWAQLVQKARDLVARIAGLESVILHRRGAEYRALAMHKLYRDALADVTRLWACLSSACNLLGMLTREKERRWFRWPEDFGHVRQSPQDQAIREHLERILDEAQLEQLWQSVTRSGLRGYQEYWRDLSIAKHVEDFNREIDIEQLMNVSAVIPVESVRVAWFSTVIMHRVLDSIFGVKQAIYQILERRNTMKQHAAWWHWTGNRIRDTLWNVIMAVTFSVRALYAFWSDVGRNFVRYRASDYRRFLQNNQWQLLFLIKYYIIGAAAIITVVSIPASTSIRKQWEPILGYLSVVVSARPTTESAVSVALTRVIGGFIGAAFGYLVLVKPELAVNAYFVEGVSMAIVYVLFYCNLVDSMKWLQYIAGIAIFIFTVVCFCTYSTPVSHAVWQNAVGAFVCTTIGVAAIILFTAALSPRMASRESRRVLLKGFRATVDGTILCWEENLTRHGCDAFRRRFEEALHIAAYEESNKPAGVTNDTDASETAASSRSEQPAADQHARLSPEPEAIAKQIEALASSVALLSAATTPSFGGLHQFALWKRGFFRPPQFVVDGNVALCVALLRLEVLHGVVHRPPIYGNRYSGTMYRMFLQALEDELIELFRSLLELVDALNECLETRGIFEDLFGSAEHVSSAAARKQQTRLWCLSSCFFKEQQSTSLQKLDSHQENGIEVADGGEGFCIMEPGVGLALLNFRRRRAELWFRIRRRSLQIAKFIRDICPELECRLAAHISSLALDESSASSFPELYEQLLENEDLDRGPLLVEVFPMLRRLMRLRDPNFQRHMPTPQPRASIAKEAESATEEYVRRSLQDDRRRSASLTVEGADSEPQSPAALANTEAVSARLDLSSAEAAETLIQDMEKDIILLNFRQILETKLSRNGYGQTEQSPMPIAGVPIDDFVHFSTFLFGLQGLLGSIDYAARAIGSWTRPHHANKLLLKHRRPFLS
jgi:hypothetical protein